MRGHKLRTCFPAPKAHVPAIQRSGPSAPAPESNSMPLPAAPAQGRRATAPPEHVAAAGGPLGPWDAPSAGLLGLSDPGGMAEVTLMLDLEASRRQLLIEQQQQQEPQKQSRQARPSPRLPQAAPVSHLPHLPPLPSHAAPAAPLQPQTPLAAPQYPPALPPLQPQPHAPRQLPHLSPHHDDNAHGLHRNGGEGEEEEEEEDQVIYDPDLDAHVARRTAAWVAAADPGAAPEEPPLFALADDHELPWHAAAAGSLHAHPAPPPPPSGALVGSQYRHTGGGAAPSGPSTCHDAHPHPHPPAHAALAAGAFGYLYPPDPLFRGQPPPPPHWRVSGDGGGGCGGRNGVRAERAVGVPEDPAAARYLERGMLLSAALKMTKDQAAARRASLASGGGGGGGRQLSLQRMQSKQSRNGSNRN